MSLSPCYCSSCAVAHRGQISGQVSEQGPHWPGVALAWPCLLPVAWTARLARVPVVEFLCCHLLSGVSIRVVWNAWLARVPAVEFLCCHMFSGGSIRVAWTASWVP